MRLAAADETNASRRRLLLAAPDATQAHLSREDRRLIAASRALADVFGLDLAVLVPERVARNDALAPAELVLTWPGSAAGTFAPQAALSALLAAVGTTDAAHVALPDTARGGDLGRRAALALERSMAASVVALENAKVISLCRADAGERALPPPFLLLLDQGFAPVASRQASRTRVVPLTMEAADERIVDLGVARGAAVARDIDDAAFIIAGGSGVSDWPALERLAESLGAVLAASRPVCDRGIVPRERQVGSSGKAVQARCYMAFGISGAVQHLDGIKDCEMVAAINSDPAAPIHVRADLSIVADAGAVMAALHARIEGAAHG